MPGPEIQASAIITALEGFPLHGRARAGSTSLLLVALGMLAPLAALRLRIFLALAHRHARAGGCSSSAPSSPSTTA